MKLISLIILAVTAFAFAETPAPAITPAATQPSRGDTVVSSVIINCPAEEIFATFKTPEGIIKAWSVANAKVDFRVGGQIRTSYSKDADLDSPAAIVNTILAYEPNRMLAIKATAPQGSPPWLEKICETGWSVLTLEPLAPDRTRITCTGMGYGEGEDYERARSFFQQGNDMVLKMMKEKFDRPGAADDAKKVNELFRSRLNSAGGDAHWISEQKLPDGSTLRGHTIWREIIGGKFVEVDGRLGDDKTMRAHAHFITGIDPVLNSAFFHQAMETGAVAGGTIQLVDEKTAAGVWHFRTPTGEMKWYIAFEFVDADNYISRMWKDADRSGPAMITSLYRRVAEVPESFDLERR